MFDYEGKSRYECRVSTHVDDSFCAYQATARSNISRLLADSISLHRSGRDRTGAPERPMSKREAMRRALKCRVMRRRCAILSKGKEEVALSWKIMEGSISGSATRRCNNLGRRV